MISNSLGIFGRSRQSDTNSAVGQAISEWILAARCGSPTTSGWYLHFARKEFQPKRISSGSSEIHKNLNL